MIKITDTARQNGDIFGGHLQEAFVKVLQSGGYILGQYVEQFEMEYAGFLGAEFCLGVGSGTDALVLALMAIGVGPGDEVITSAASFYATSSAIMRVGAKPVFVDILNDTTDLIDPHQITAAITPNTKAILPVHLHGYTCDMETIMAVAQQHGLYVIEDCAQAHGAIYEFSHGDYRQGPARKAVGTIGHIGCFSFFPTKNLGALGDGGAIVTDDPEIYARIKSLREHGNFQKDTQASLGLNSRLDAMQAAFLSVKLGHLEEFNELRQNLAREYSQVLGQYDLHPCLILPRIRPNAVFHHYPLRIGNEPNDGLWGKRDEVQKQMLSYGIETRAYYPVCQAMQRVYIDHHVPDDRKNEYCAQVSQTNAFIQSQNTLALPLFPELTQNEVHYICKKLALIIKGMLVQ